MRLFIVAILFLLPTVSLAEFVLVDANDRRIGYFLESGPNNSEMIGMRYGRRVIKLPVHRSGFRQTGQVYFTELGCAGTAYLESRELLDLFQDRLRAVISARHTLYLREPTAVKANRTFLSYRGIGGCFNATFADVPSYEARPVIDLRFVFVTPFRFLPPTDLVDLATE